MSGTFSYVLIPADASLPIQSLSASKSGGLSDDALQKKAKQYFFERSDKKAMQGQFMLIFVTTVSRLRLSLIFVLVLFLQRR